MKARAIVGKTVASVQQSRFFNARLQKMVVGIDSITFTDGTVIIPQLNDDGIDNYTDFLVRRQS